MQFSFHEILSYISDLGDSGLLSVLVFLAALYLFVAGNLRAALALTSAFLFCVVIMGFLKIYFIGCTSQYLAYDIESPSGHAAMGAAIYGTIAAIIVTQYAGWRRWLTVSLALPLILTIAISRVLLEHHSVNEVIIGLGVGSMIALFSFVCLRNAPKAVFKLRYLTLACATAFAFLYGTNAPAEGLIRKIAEILVDSFQFCS